MVIHKTNCNSMLMHRNRWDIERLESPVKLLDRYMQHLEHSRETIDLRAQAVQLEVEFHEQIEVSEEEVYR